MKFKSVIFMVLLLATVLAIGSVSAMDDGTTDDAISVEQNDNIAVEDNDAQVASVENGDDIISADNSLAADDGSNVLSDSENSGQSTSNSSSQQSQPAKTKTQTKMFYFGQIKVPIKYKKYLLKDYKPSIKNKKAWKEYKAYKKIYNKQMKLFKKYLKKLIPKLQKKGWTIKGKNVNKEWQFTNKNDFKYKTKLTKKNVFMKFYCRDYRTI